MVRVCAPVTTGRIDKLTNCIGRILTSYLGSVGFILANCVNMSVRIARSLLFIRNIFAELTSTNQINLSFLPSLRFFAVLVVALVLTKTSEVYLCCDTALMWRAAHVLVGGAIFIVTLAAIYKLVCILCGCLVVLLPIHLLARSLAWLWTCARSSAKRTNSEYNLWFCVKNAT
jgi:hypothetical protein